MKINKLIILLLFLAFAGVLQAQVSEYDYKAAFIERFTRFVEWPEEFEDNTFKVAVFGKNPFNTTLDNLFADIKIKNQDVELIYTNNIVDIIDVNLVFISTSEKKRIKEILAFTDKNPILTIGDSKGFSAKGVHINMYVDDNYIRYEINEIAIEKSDLKVSSLLLASAKIVKTDD
jgi:YfiR/HmsC-like